MAACLGGWLASGQVSTMEVGGMQGSSGCALPASVGQLPTGHCVGSTAWPPCAPGPCPAPHHPPAGCCPQFLADKGRLDAVPL